MSELITELKNLMYKKKRKTLIYMLFVVLKYKIQSNIIEFYNIIGELINANYKYFLNNCYFRLKNKVSKRLTPEKLFEMDKYILENFCFGEKEKLLTSFKGEIKRRWVNVFGYIYLTNFRFLADGKLTEKSVKKSSAIGPKRIYELPFYLASTAIRSARQKKREAIESALPGALKISTLNIFKKSFPIINTYNTERTKDRLGLNYSIKVEYQVKDKIKEKEIKFTIKIARGNKEKHKDLINRSERILSIIEETLLTSQLS